MRKYKQAAKDFLFLLKPYWRHGRLYIFFKLFSEVVAATVGMVVTVTIAQSVIDAVIAGKVFSDLLLIVGINFAVLLVAEVFQISVKSFYTNWKETEIMNRITRDVLLQAQRTDFKYIDDPEYYNALQIAVDTYWSSSSRMISNSINLCSSLVGITAMFAIISQISSVVVLLTVVGVVASTFIQMRSVNFGLDYRVKALPAGRKMTYTQRMYTNHQAASDLKSTDVSRSLIEMFNSANRDATELFRNLQRKYGVLQLGSFVSDRVTNYLVILYIAWGLLNGRIESVGQYTTLIAAAMQLNSMIRDLLALVPEIKLRKGEYNQIKTFGSSLF